MLFMTSFSPQSSSLFQWLSSHLCLGTTPQIFCNLQDPYITLRHPSFLCTGDVAALKTLWLCKSYAAATHSIFTTLSNVTDIKRTEQHGIGD